MRPERLGDRRRLAAAGFASGGTRTRGALLLTVAVAALLPSCASFIRPEGDGGWSTERRRQEVEQRATAAGATTAPTQHVSPEPVAAPESAGAAQAPAATAEGGEALPPLDLRSALDLAAKGNRRIAEAERQLDVSREQVFDTRGRLLPATTGQGRYTWYTAAQTTQVNLEPGILPPGTVPPNVTVREQDFGTVNGTLALPLDLSGELWHALRAAQAGYRGEAARLWATRLEQDLVVIRAYFDLLAAERLREVTAQTVAVNREQVSVANDQYTHGRLTKNGLLVAQVALSQSEQELRSRDLTIDQARWALNQAIGREVNAPTRVIDVRARPALPSEGDALEAAYADNPVLRALIEEQQRLEETETSLARSRLPRLNAGAAIDYSSAQIFQPQTVGSGFVGFTWDLGTDTRREAEIAQAKIEADQNRVRVERELRELEEAVRSAHAATVERLSALDAAEIAVGQAEENLRIRRVQFDVGRAQSEDVLDAERRLAEQRATLATALYSAHARRADLQRLMGRPLDELPAVSGGR